MEKSIDKAGVKKLYEECSDLGKSYLKQMFPEAFEPECAIQSIADIDPLTKVLSLSLGLNEDAIQELHEYGNPVDGKGLYLSPKYDWIMKERFSSSRIVGYSLIPYKKP